MISFNWNTIRPVGPHSVPSPVYLFPLKSTLRLPRTCDLPLFWHYLFVGFFVQLKRFDFRFFPWVLFAVVPLVVVPLVVVVVVIVTRCYYANIELLNCMVHASFNRIVAGLYKAREREGEREGDKQCASHTLLLLKFAVAVVAASLWPFMLHKLQRLSFVTCVKIDCNFWMKKKKKQQKQHEKLQCKWRSFKNGSYVNNVCKFKFKLS